ncbi:hypothetical protein OG496_50975 [Streptomyces sp. NBC_00988]|uniref:hypothetical protein n=1 Tax=Streptomyces sp. NBC_00988 TaxID=2903704 RepID=UPI003865D1ED|nr:hypothetical protein OG496_50975 [Streptomyces sp. NBC_00988]
MTDDGVRPEQVRMAPIDQVGPGDAAFLYAISAVMVLCGPVMLGLAVFTGADLMVMGAVFTVVFVPVGLGFWGNTAVGREESRRLDAVGVPAIAEITDLTDFDWDGESSGVEVGLRVSGPELRTFEATWRRTYHPGLRVGRRLAAVVDASGGRFRVEL